jgi:hypothetical protein
MVTKNGNSIDIKRLQTLYAVSEVNKAAFDSFARREKISTETRVERMLQVLYEAGRADASRKDVVDLFKALEQAHCGEFLIGRRGHSSRFAWSVSLIDVGQAAAGETATVDPLSEAEKAADEPDDSALDHIEHGFVLRPGVKIAFKLPKDLTKVEAGRMADFIRTLPFDV